MAIVNPMGVVIKFFILTADRKKIGSHGNLYAHNRRVANGA